MYNLYDLYMAPTSVSVSQARAQLPEFLNRAAYGNQRILICRHGKPLAAVVPVRDLDLLERLTKLVKKKGALSARKARKLLRL